MNFSPYLQYSKIFIETGTNKGDGIQRALDSGFEKVLSVEANQDLFIKSRERFFRDGRVKIWFGKSYDTLPEMLTQINERCVFWLDAHPSGPGTAGHINLVQGDTNWHQDSIIKKELAVILAHRNDHVILIDDMQGLDELTQGYINTILAVNQAYKWEFFDEQLHEIFHKEKILAFTV